MHFVFCKRTQNGLSFALRWWTECDFCTEQLLEGLTNTAKWNAINLAHSTIAACLLYKGRWAYIKVDWGLESFSVVFWRKWTPQISYRPTSDELIVILSGNLCCPQSYFHSILHLISWRKFLLLTFLLEMMSCRKFCMFNFLSQYCRYNYRPLQTI